MKEIKYHPSVNFHKRESFPGLFNKLDEDFQKLVDTVREKNCKGVTTPLVYNLTEWLSYHLSKQMGYVIRFRKQVMPILLARSVDTSVTSGNFGQKFYGTAERAVEEIIKQEGKPLKSELRVLTVMRIDRYIPTKGKKRSLPAPTAEQVQQITDSVKKISLTDICSLARKSHIATEEKFLTSFCSKLLGELGITIDAVSGTHVYNSSTGDKHLIRRQVIKAVMSQLRLRIAQEAQDRGILKIGDPLLFSSKPRIFLRVSYTGMLIIPQGDDNSGKTTHVDPLYYPLLKAIEDHQSMAVPCSS